MALDITASAPTLLLVLLFVDIPFLIQTWINHFKVKFSHFFNGFVSLSELDKPNEFKRSLVCDVYFFVLARRPNLMLKKTLGFMF